MIRRTIAAPAVACAVAVASAWPVLLRPGLPAYEHDWSWPFERTRVLTGAVNHFFVWDAAGLGKPNALASDHVFHLLVAAPALLLPAGVCAKLVLAAALCLAALSAYRFARRALGATALAASCGAVFYACSPVTINKIGAGHVAYWIAYALLPLLAERSAAYAAVPSRSRFFQVALLSAACTFQLQFAVYGTIAAVAAAGPNVRRALAVAGACIAGAFTVLLPSAYAFASSSTYVPVLFQAPRLAWQNAMSAGFPDALWMAQYVVPYYRVPGFAFAALQVCIAAAIVAGVVRRRSLFAFAVLLVAGLFFATGTSGPAGGAWSWLYANVPAATVFRESYDANALVALAYVAGIAALSRVPAAAWVFAAVLVLAISPLLGGSIGRTVPNVLPPQSATVSLSGIPDGRIAALPLDSPVVYDGRAPGGVDIFAPADARHPTLAEYPALFPLTALSLSKCACEPWLLDELARMNVSAVVARPKMQSADLLRQKAAAGAPARMSIRAVPRLHALVDSPVIAVEAPLSFRDALPSETVAASDPRGPFPGGTERAAFVLPPFDKNIDDPQRVWVSAQRWFAAAPDPFTADPAGVTTRSRVPLLQRLPPGRWFMLYESAGDLTVTSAGRAQRIPASVHARWQALAGGEVSVQVLQRGKNAIVYRFARGAPAVPAGRFTKLRIVSVARKSPTRIEVETGGAARGPALVELRERYSPNWTIDGATVLWHGVGDGYANLFLVQSAPERFSVTYAPQRFFFILCMFCWLLQAAGLFAAFGSRRAV